MRTLTQIISHPTDTIYTLQALSPVKRSLVRDVGVLGLFSGLLANVLSHEVYFWASQPVQRYLEPWLVQTFFGDMPSSFQVLSVVCVCSLVPMLVSFPLKVLKHRMQVNRDRVNNRTSNAYIFFLFSRL